MLVYNSAKSTIRYYSHIFTHSLSVCTVETYTFDCSGFSLFMETPYSEHDRKPNKAHNPRHQPPLAKFAVMRNKRSSNQCLVKIRLMNVMQTTSLNSQTRVQPTRIGHVFQRLSFSPASFAGIIHTKESGKVQTGNV